MSDEAHVIVWVYPQGRYTDTRLYAVHLGTQDEAEYMAEELNKKFGYDDRDEEDGYWWGPHYAVETVPIWRRK